MTCNNIDNVVSVPIDEFPDEYKNHRISLNQLALIISKKERSLTRLGKEISHGTNYDENISGWTRFSTLKFARFMEPSDLRIAVTFGIVSPKKVIFNLRDLIFVLSNS